MSRVKTCVAATMAASLMLVTACSGGSDLGGDSKASGPVTVEWWGWAPGQAELAGLFNGKHTDIQIKYVQQPGNKEANAALTNVIKAGGSVPCLVQATGSSTAMLTGGLAQDVTQYLAPHASSFAKAALDSVSLQGKQYGVPVGLNPSFLVVNKAVYDANGVAVPTTWEGLIEAGKQLQAKDKTIKVFNTAGEDPSTLVSLADQAGAKWFQIDGDGWKVRMNDAPSKKAGRIIQELVDNNLNSQATYQDRPALIQFFDSGKMVTLPTSTWQLGNYEKNFKQSLGHWAPVPLPTYQGEAAAPPSGGGFTMVPPGCKSVEAAVKAAVWMATDPEAVALNASPVKGSGTFPAVKDPAPYAEAAIPPTLFGANKAQAKTVIEDAAVKALPTRLAGPDDAAMLDELADGWAKVIKKQQTTDQLLDHMQQWVLKDLSSKGIKATEG